LSWTQGNDALQITFALFIFPLAMNAVQYWVIDNFIMDKKREAEKSGYEAVQDDDEDGQVANEENEEATPEYADALVVGNGQTEAEESLREANPTAIPQYTAVIRRGEGSERNNPRKGDERDVGR